MAIQTQLIGSLTGGGAPYHGAVRGNDIIEFGQPGKHYYVHVIAVYPGASSSAANIGGSVLTPTRSVVRSGTFNIRNNRIGANEYAELIIWEIPEPLPLS